MLVERETDARKLFQIIAAKLQSLAPLPPPERLAQAAKAAELRMLAALGETHSAFPGEDHKHNGVFRCCYEETKHCAHRLLETRQKQGAPIVSAILGGVFGPGGASGLDTAMRDYLAGKLPFQPATATLQNSSPLFGKTPLPPNSGGQNNP